MFRTLYTLQVGYMYAKGTLHVRYTIWLSPNCRGSVWNSSGNGPG